MEKERGGVQKYLYDDWTDCYDAEHFSFIVQSAVRPLIEGKPGTTAWNVNQANVVESFWQYFYRGTEPHFYF